MEFNSQYLKIFANSSFLNHFFQQNFRKIFPKHFLTRNLILKDKRLLKCRQEPTRTEYNIL
jgi:hypothetical protein